MIQLHSDFGKGSLLSLREVFSYVQNEESHHNTMLHSSSQAQFALVSASQRNSKDDFKSRDGGKVTNATSDDKDKLFCDHCNRSRHTRKTCWRLHGHPTRGCEGHSGGGTRPRANHTSMVETIVSTPDASSLLLDTGVFSKEEVDTSSAYVSIGNICYCILLLRSYR
jgi:hypothetical protein